MRGRKCLLFLEILRMKDNGASPVSISMYQYINSFVAGDLYILSELVVFKRNRQSLSIDGICEPNLTFITGLDL